MDNESNEAVLRAVSLLLDDSSPTILKVSLDDLFREYLTSFEQGVFPLNYHQVVNDHYFLQDFLTKLESIKTPKQNQFNTKNPTD
jgi:hypothetical protein